MGQPIVTAQCTRLTGLRVDSDFGLAGAAGSCPETWLFHIFMGGLRPYPGLLLAWHQSYHITWNLARTQPFCTRQGQQLHWQQGRLTNEVAVTTHSSEE
jgi:hypothetical protein